MQASQQYFFTKNEVFNEIANLRWGSSLLILDETHFESLLFLDALLQKSLPPAKTHIVSYHDTGATLETMKLDLEQYTSLQEISIVINRLREQVGPWGVIIHHYLPHILTREPEETVLRMLEFWTTKTAEKNLIEFYTLPQGTFSTMEKKASAFMTGEISIRFGKTEKERQLSFAVKRACKPEYHLVEFPFMIKDSRLLIKWGEEFTDKLPVEPAQIQQKIAYLKENIRSLKLRMTSIPSQGLTPHDYLILTQIDGMHLADVQVIFPDMFDSILKKVACWNLQGAICLEQLEEREFIPVKGHLSPLSKIGLLLPTGIAVRILHRKPRSVPTESYLALRKSVEILCKIFMPTQREPLEMLPSIEEFAQEVATRITAVERIKAAGEDPRVQFDIKSLPQIVSLTLQISLGVKPMVRVTPQGTYEVTVAACSLCKYVQSDHPICRMIAAMLIGACAIPFKRHFTCNEVKCKAMGAEACVFIIKPD